MIRVILTGSLKGEIYQGEKDDVLHLPDEVAEGLVAQGIAVRYSEEPVPAPAVVPEKKAKK